MMQEYMAQDTVEGKQDNEEKDFYGYLGGLGP
jgi:hypothetical protein